MNFVLPLLLTILLLAVVLIGAGVAELSFLFGIIIPYIAIAVFIAGILYRVIKWGRAPVPFAISTTTGQQKSLPWIKNNTLESPHNRFGVIGRMALEILFFRSLFRNTKSELTKGPKITYGETKWLWLGALAFHWSLLVVLLRHFRFFIEPVPFFVPALQSLDGLFQIGVPVLFATDIVVLGGLTYLFLRRAFIPQLRYISLIADYFPVFLLLGIIVSGILMRYFIKVDLIAVKELFLSFASFRPGVPEGVGLIFFVHLFFVCVLLIYFPFSKLMHMGGIFLSPTRNLANDSRCRRHVNPWNHEVKTHTYEEYEDEFRDVMKAAGLPLEKEG
jgi:nitrate reductase gamma subunit